MNAQEQRRVIILTQVVSGAGTVAGAAERLALSERQTKRLLAGFRRDGVAALAHRNRGRPPAHALSEEMREAARGLATGKYAGFNQQHLTEQLCEGEGIALSRSSVRRILLEEGIRSPRTRRAPKHRSRRERRGQAGSLVQIDASAHDWLEGRGPRLTLFAAIDDATHGRPLARYHDRHGIFRVNAPQTVAQQLTGEREPTQFGGLLDELGIASIAARSPRAKGRVERLFGTLQDRLVSMLRLAEATNEVEATVCLPSSSISMIASWCRRQRKESATGRWGQGETATPSFVSRIGGRWGWTTRCASAVHGCTCCPVRVVGRGRGRWSRCRNGSMVRWPSILTEHVS